MTEKENEGKIRNFFFFPLEIKDFFVEGGQKEEEKKSNFSS